MTQTQPIFGLLRRIEDDSIRREALTLVGYLGIQTVQGLANYSKQYLVNNDITPETLDELERLLTAEYNLNFNPQERTKQIPEPTPTSTYHPRVPYQPRSVRASGAPPPSILESVPHHFGLGKYLKR